MVNASSGTLSRRRKRHEWPSDTRSGASPLPPRLHDVWVTGPEDMEFDTEKMSLVTGYAYEDQDDEMSRSSGRKYNGQPFLRRPILRIEKND